MVSIGLSREGGMSHEEFWNTYEFLSATTTPMGITVPTLESGNSTDGQLTKKVRLEFTHREIGNLPVNSSKILTAQLVLKNKVIYFFLSGKGDLHIRDQR